MISQKSSHSLALRLVRFGLAAMLLFTACSFATSLGQPSGQTAAPAKATEAVQVQQGTMPAANTSIATASPNPQPTAIESAATEPAAAKPAATEPVSQPGPAGGGEGVTFDYHAIPLGQKLEAAVDGRKVAIQVQKVITGKDADAIALSKAPEEMQWLIIQLLVTYSEGEKGIRAQLLSEDMFDIVSKGYIDTVGPVFTFTPSPHISDINLLPGEESLGYLSFQAYKDDPSPLLRLSLGQDESFFSLTGQPVPIAQPESGIQLTDESITRDQPVPVGTSASVEYRGAVYKIQVQKVLRDFNAWKKISDGWGINKEPPDGQEYVMPYVSVQVARASQVKTEFDSGQFSIWAKGGESSQPLNFFCPLPCFQPATLYPNGEVSGWIPLLTPREETSPLLVFDQRLFFKLTPEPGQAANFQRSLSENAIGFANREAIQRKVTLHQVGPVNVIAFSPDDHFAVTGGDDKLLHIWDTETGVEAGTLKGHKARVRDISFSLDGNWLASTSAASEILVWDTGSWHLLKTLPLKGKGFGVKYLPDGTLLSVTEAGVVQIWDVASGKPVRQEWVPRNASSTCASASVVSFDTSDDGATLAAALSCGFGIVWHLGDTAILFGDSNHQKDIPSGRIPIASAITLSPDGKEAVYGAVYYPNRDLTLMDVIDVEKKEVLASVSPMDPDLFAAKVAPNRDLILAGVGNIVYVFWPEASVWGGKNLLELTGHSGRVTALEFSNNGEILASGDYVGNTILWVAK